MNNRKNYSKGRNRYKIVETMHMCNVITIRMFQLMVHETDTIRVIMCAMKKEGIVEKYKREKDGKSFYCFADYGAYVEEFRKCLPEGYTETYQTFGMPEVRHAKAEAEYRFDKIIRDSEALLVMHEAGINSYVDQKPNLSEPLSPIEPMYYTSKELKRRVDLDAGANTGDAARQISGTRINGVIMAPTCNYVIYNFGDNMRRWNITSEFKMKVHLERFLNSKLPPPQAVTSAILFTYDEGMKIFMNMLTDDSTKKNTLNLAKLEMVYNHIYILPYGKIAVDYIKAMTKEGWDSRMKEDVTGEPPQPYSPIGTVCDYYEEDSEIYTFVFCVPDIILFRYFMNRAMLEEKREKYRVICFDFQKEYVMRVIGRYARVFTMEYEKYKEIARDAGHMD